MADYLETDIKFLSGIGPRKAEILNKEIDVFTVNDLLHYFPYKHIDRSRVYSVHEVDASMPYIQLKGQITAFETAGEGRKKRLIAHFTDGRGFIDLVWFQGQKFITDKYKTYTPYLIFGKPTPFGQKINIPHPDIDPYKEDSLQKMGLMPYYNTTDKMKNHYLNSKAIQKCMENAFSAYAKHMVETLPDSVIREARLMDIRQAMENIHFPKQVATLNNARYRFKFEELFYIQLNILRYTLNKKSKFKGFIFNKVGEPFLEFYENSLPFELTNAQKRTIKEIRKDLGSGVQMNRLLQGDVGSGKTLVAFMLMLIAAGNGFQSSLMVPTEILGTQHFHTISEFLNGMNLRVELLTGSTPKKKREAIHAGLLNGEINILIGTHALIEATVQFQNLGLVIIDEQHRFGVVQRSKLWTKNECPPHVLVMTATPIPRTLAMTVYGDLDVSVIDELPPGRKPVRTILQYDKRRASLYASMRKQLELGRQVYIVYPLIEESETLDLKNLEEGYDVIREVFPQYKVCKLHGKMKPKEKDEVMGQFVRNEAQIMVATTVIEVGVNVPNASVMVIESAQRFGLSQLHQLRGRVGRGAEQSFCILVAPYELSANTRKRLEIMVESNDGFEIAEADLKLRGPGDMEGTLQSGVAFNLKIADLARDGDILTLARQMAEKILLDDPELQHPENLVLRKQLSKLTGNRYNWGMIS
ncbi:MAG: ATP-dependent helicase RecG [Bacteroidetes bacterium]|nr:ATP-dependent helicase RecG [Bacteroidota bacterium]